MLSLARRFEGKLTLTPGEHEKDALAGAVGVALKRASIFGRAPVIHDLTVALTIWGFLDDVPRELVELRRHLFEEVSHPHHYGGAPDRRSRPRGGPPADTGRDHRGPPARTGARCSASSPPAPTDQRTHAGRPVPSDGDPGPSPPLRALAHGLPPRGQRPRRAVQLARGPPHRRRDAAPGRGHRPGAVQLRAGREHPGVAPLARPRLGRRASCSRPTTSKPTARRRSRCSARARPTGATARASRCRPGRRSAAVPPATTGSAATAASPRATPPRCASACPTTGTTTFTDMVRGEVTLREQDDRGLRAAALHRHADVPALQRLRRRRHGHHPRRAGRGPRAGHPEVPPAPRRARPRSARGVRPPADARERGPPEAVQAQGRGVGRRLRRRGLPARGDGQLPRPARLGAEGRRRDPPAGRDRRAVPPRGRHPVAGVLRREEAAAHQRRVHPRPARRRVPRAQPRPFLTRGDAALEVLRPLAALVQERVRAPHRGRADDRLPARRAASRSTTTRGRRRW